MTIKHMSMERETKKAHQESDYMPERSGTGGTDSERESLETESANCSEWGGAGSTEGRKTGRGKRRSVIADVDVVWRSFEE